MSAFIQQYGAFVFGLIIGLAVKLSWLAHSSNGAVTLVLKIDTEKLK